MRVAIVHYWLVSHRGGERVVEVLGEMFPEADIFTLVYDPEQTSPAFPSIASSPHFCNRCLSRAGSTGRSRRSFQWRSNSSTSAPTTS
jgi:hypothetical protein